MSKSTGNIFFNDYKEAGDKKPKFTGSLEITREQIQELVADGKAGKDVKLKMSAWEYPSKKDPNQVYYFLIAESGEFDKKKKDNSWGEDTDDCGF
jgi:hypothetical protein